MIWLYIIWGGFAALGVVTFVRWVTAGSRQVMETANNLVSTLKDATEVARAYREDLEVLRMIAQSGTQTPLGDEPESIIPQPPAVPSTMPPPYLNRYPIKPNEPEAPLESVTEVDVTATDEEILEQSSEEAAGDVEAQERLKSATQKADMERIKQLTGYESNEKPEAK